MHQHALQGLSMSLYRNMNARKSNGSSRPKSAGTVSDKSYSNMKAGFPKSKKAATTAKRKPSMAKSMGY